MPQKTDILPKTIDSDIVVTSLRALHSLEDYPISQGLYLIVGGTAVQSYLPSANRRPTSDIDLSVVRPLNYENFKKFVNPMYEFLRDGGYEVETHKRDSRFQLLVTTSDGQDNLSVEFSRRNERKFAQISSRLERELSHGRRKAIAGTSSSYVVAAPEDITIPKLVRGVGSLERNPQAYSELTHIYQSESPLPEILSHVVGERAIADRTKVAKDVEIARLKADLYDILALSTFVGFNQPYLAESAAEWKKLTIPGEQRNYLIELLSLCL